MAWQAGIGVPAALALVGLVCFAFKRSRDAAEARASLRVDAERRSSADALSESEARLRVATEGAGLGIYEFDFRRRAIWLDAGAAALLDAMLPSGVWLPFDSQDSTAFVARIHPDDRASRANALSAVASGRADSLALEYRIRCSDGGWKWIWTNGTSLERDPVSGKPQRLIGVIRDITERHQLEADLHQAQKLQALGELAGGIAHDFNNVLQTVAGGAVLIEQSAEDAIVRRRARMVIEAAERGASTTRRLLAFARRGDLRAESVDPAELLRGLQEILSPSLGASIAICVEAEVGLPPMLVDKGQLETALVNLATNARDAMPGGGTLTLSATEQQVPEGRGAPPVTNLIAGRYIRVSVRDTGKGMTAALLARVGEPFFTTKPTGQGTGLGLPMVKGFAEQSGGAFMVESEPGQGTTVTIWFPLAGDEAASTTTVRSQATNLTGQGDTLSILVVDDEPAVCETLADTLKAAGYAVLPAANGTEAVALLDAGEKVDAMVTDLTMPGMDGLALIREARKRRPGLPVVLLTGYVGDIAALAVGSTQGGPFSLLRKPIFGAQLADRVAALVEAAASTKLTADVGLG